MSYEQDGDGAPAPELEAVQQQEHLDPIVTCVEGTVRTQSLPARVAVLHNVSVGTAAVCLAGADPRRARAVIWASGAAGDSVSVFGTDSVDAASVVGDALLTLPASSLPAGRYQIDAYTLLSEATTPDATNVLAISVGGTALARILTFNAAQSSTAFQPKQPFTLPGVYVDGTQAIAITVAVAETGTNSQTFDMVLVATRLDAGAVYLGTRQDAVEQATAARIGETPLEMRHCEALWAKAESGLVNVSYLLEQWAD